ncbi:MAG: DegV family protein [Clostridia bacterium]|nr:DegV family protein [Clostridia bacterium]
MERYHLLVDSCCDLSPEQIKSMDASVAPLTITIDSKNYVDDGTVEIVPYLNAMKASLQPARSACPSPELYMQDMLKANGDCFVVTLSSRLSGSYNSAMLGREMALEVNPNKRIHVFDSESASAGETQIAMLIDELIKAKRSFDDIVEIVSERIRNMRTLFVLDSLDNLVKNGRLAKTAAAIANVLSIRPVMSDDGIGGIKMVGKGRGIKGALAQMVETIRKQTEQVASRSRRLTLSYCNCRERAEQLREMIWNKCPAIGEIIMTPTSALSSMYAYDGGIVIAF